MKVELRLSDETGDPDKIAVTLWKGKTEDEMHSGCLVGFYHRHHWEDLSMYIEDLNNAFRKMWH